MLNINANKKYKKQKENRVVIDGAIAIVVVIKIETPIKKTIVTIYFGTGIGTCILITTIQIVIVMIVMVHGAIRLVIATVIVIALMINIYL